jgi:hypothetical protein
VAERQTVNGKPGLFQLLNRGESVQRSKLRAVRALMVKAGQRLEARLTPALRSEVAGELTAARKALELLRAYLPQIADPAERQNLSLAVDGDLKKLGSMERRLHSQDRNSDGFHPR